jgi:hypothetical protein
VENDGKSMGKGLLEDFLNGKSLEWGTSGENHRKYMRNMIGEIWETIGNKCLE